MTLRFAPALLAAGAAVTLLAACGSDAADDPTSKSTASSGATRAAAAAAPKDGGAVDGPCDVTDQATVASVFAGAGPGTEGQVRNCEYEFTSGTVQVVNVYYYADTTLEQFTKQDTDNGITFDAVQIGDGAIRDQLHTLTVQQGDILFSVQALPRSGVEASKLAQFDPQTTALAKLIAAGL